MARPAARVCVTLPQWCASVRREGAEMALAVLNAQAGCDAHAFELAGQPSTALIDGDLFDEEALARDLGQPAGVTPAALVAAAYRRWGPALVEHLDGCYLVAVWDGAARRLILGHDALGRHPAYYADRPDGFWFGSNILALVDGARIPRDPNRLSLALGLLAFWPEAGETSFADVRRLRPGHVLEWRATTGVIERAYWDPMPEDEEPWIPDAEARARFEPALEDAVARVMALDPQGIMLSGGVDSVTVAALAAAWGRPRGRDPLVAVSGRTGYALSPEEAMQAKVADALGMPHRVSTTAEWCGGRDGIELSLEAVRDLPSPSRVHWVGTYMRFYRRTAADGLRVLLTGAGGDNWLGVSRTYAADLWRGLQLADWWRFMKADVSMGVRPSTSAWRLLWTHGLRPHADSVWARVAPGLKARVHRRGWESRLPAWLCPDADLRQRLVEALLARRTPDLTPAGRAPRSYYRHSVRTLTNPYMHYENEVAFHVERLCGLCLLSPYHDKRLVAFFHRISPRALIEGDRYKGLLRTVAARRLPGLGLERQRKDEGRADVERLRLLREGIARAWPPSDLSCLESLGLVDARALSSSLPAWESQSAVELGRAHILMSTARWLDIHAPA